MLNHEKFQEQCYIILKALCELCPHQNDTHAMNCIECCPIGRAKDKTTHEVKNGK